MASTQSQPKPLPEFLTAKDYANLTGKSYRTACRDFAELREWYDPPLPPYRRVGTVLVNQWMTHKYGLGLGF